MSKTSTDLHYYFREICREKTITHSIKWGGNLFFLLFNVNYLNTSITDLFRRRCRRRLWSASLGAGVGCDHWRRFVCRGRTGRRPCWRGSQRVVAGCVRCRIPDHTRDIYNKNSKCYISVLLFQENQCKCG